MRDAEGTLKERIAELTAQGKQDDIRREVRIVTARVCCGWWLVVGANVCERLCVNCGDGGGGGGGGGGGVDATKMPPSRWC